MYNVQNEGIRAASHQDADAAGGIKKKDKFPIKVMIWCEACREGLTTPVIFDNGTLNHEKYIDFVLPVAVKSGTEIMGSNWNYQPNGSTAHTHHLNQQWCTNHLPAFVPKDRWPPNSLGSTTAFGMKSLTQ